jgi:tRNA-specific 2-thiouridylase
MKTAVALSGGVDSSVAAALIQEEEGAAFGVTMRLFAAADELSQGGMKSLPVAGGRRGRCCGGDDTDVARLAARTLGIPFYVLDMEPEFRRAVVDPFVAAYRAGRTPIPCTACNSQVKFEHLLRRALGLGATRLATGHYARLGRESHSGRRTLARGLDREKDQSYFLFGMTQEMLEQVRFPVGGMTKEEVRRLARTQGLPNADKAESQDICFVPDGDYRGFVRRTAAEAEAGGEIVNRSGHVLGRHEGLSGFTVGQRRGLGLGGGEKAYVVALERDLRRVVVGPREAAFCRQLETEAVNWVSCAAPSHDLECEVQVRHRQEPVPATVSMLPHGRAQVRFARPVLAPAAGQAAVFYGDEQVLGGAVIENAVCDGSGRDRIAQEAGASLTA